MIPDDLIITRRSSEKPICIVPTEALVQSDTPLAIDTASMMALFMRVKVKYFSLQSLLGLSSLLNKCMTNQFRTALIRRLKELNLSLIASIISPAKREWLRCTRLLFLRCALSLHGHSSGNTHWAYKSCYHYFQVNIKPTRPTTSTSRNYPKAFLRVSIFWFSFLGSH